MTEHQAGVLAGAGEVSTGCWLPLAQQWEGAVGKEPGCHQTSLLVPPPWPADSGEPEPGCHRTGLLVPQAWGTRAML